MEKIIKMLSADLQCVNYCLEDNLDNYMYLFVAGIRDVHASILTCGYCYVRHLFLII